MKTKSAILTALAFFLAGTSLFAQAAAEATLAKTTVPAKSTKPVATKDTVAVAKVTAFPALKAKLVKENRVEALNRLIESMTDNLGSAIHGTRRLEVVTVNDLDVVVAAIERGEHVLAGENQAYPAALKSFKYALSIKIDDYQDRVIKQRFEAIDKEIESREIRIGVIANFIEGATGKIVESPTFSMSKKIVVEEGKYDSVAGGSKTDAIISELTRELCKKIAFKLADFIAPPRVLVAKNGVVTINKGEDTDVFAGQIYEIYNVGEELIDPDTGESLGKEEELVGTVQVTTIRSKFCQAKILEDKGIAKGAIARPVVQKKK